MRYSALFLAALGMLLARPGTSSAGTGFLAVPSPDGQPSRFLADLGNMRCAVLPDGLAFVMAAADGGPSTAKGLAALIHAPMTATQVGEASTTSRCVVRLDFVGANPQALPCGRGPLPGTVNLYLGRDQRRWRSESKRFAEIVYEKLWPGVDLVVRPGDSGLSYELVSDDPQLLQGAGMRLRGGTPLQARDNEDGVSTALGDLFVSPTLGRASLGRVWCDAPTGRSASAKGEGTARAESRASSVLWSTYLGGSDGDELRGLSSDSAGRVFVTGFTYSLDYPVTPGAFQMEKELDEDVVLTALDGDTGYPLWSTYLGGDSLDEGWAFAVLPSGNLIAAGRTWSTDFPTTPGAIDSTREALEAAFVAELEAATGHLIWCTLLDGGFVRSVAVASDGAIVTAGDTYMGLLPSTADAFDQTFNGGNGDAFLARISDQGRHLDWCTYLGSSSTEKLRDLSLDSEDRPIVVGFTAGGSSPAFPVTAQAYDPTFAGGELDGFVSKFSADGHDLLWSTYLGGELDDWILGLELRHNGDVVLGGVTGSASFPITASAYQSTLHGLWDGMISTLSADGTALIQSTYLGGEGQDHIIGVSLSPTGTIVVSGGTSGPTFPGPLGRDQHAVHMDNGTSDAFLAELSAHGEVLLNSIVMGGTDHEQGVFNCWTTQQTVVMAGTTWSDDFPVTAGCYDGTFGNGSDIFVVNIGSFVTPVFLGVFEASRTPAGALVHWEIGAGSSASRVCLWRETGSGTRAALARWESVGPGTTQFEDGTAPRNMASYWLQVTDQGQETWYGPAQLAAATLPERLAITSNAPNPFNPRTTIRYSLPQATHAALGLYDQRGRLVRSLVDASLPAGEQVVEWDGRDAHGALAASGTYIVRLVTEQGVRASKITLAK